MSGRGKMGAPFLAASAAVFSLSLSERMPATAVSMSFVCCRSSGFSAAFTTCQVQAHIHS